MKKLKITIVLMAIISTCFGQAPAIKSELIGKGSPVLLLPGFATPGSIWEETVNNLETKNEYHLISYAGFNGNESIEMPWYSTIKEELIDYIKINNLTDLQIIGHSMGGNLAIDLAAVLPDRVVRLILVESIPCMRELMMPGVAAEYVYYDSPYNKQMLAMDSTQFKNMAIGMATNMTFNKEKQKMITNWLIEADRETYVYGYTDLLKLDLRDVLSQVRAETLILGASFPDVEVAKTNYEKQYANLVNKTIEMASNSKHFIMFDQPTWFYQQVNTFLSNE